MDKLILKKTCDACPEQYDVYLESSNELVGYLRLRWGGFSVYLVGKYSGIDWNNPIYQSEVAGYGCFHDNERGYFLEKACQAILRKMDKNDI